MRHQQVPLKLHYQKGQLQIFKFLFYASFFPRSTPTSFQSMPFVHRFADLRRVSLRSEFVRTNGVRDLGGERFHQTTQLQTALGCDLQGAPGCLLVTCLSDFKICIAAVKVPASNPNFLGTTATVEKSICSLCISVCCCLLQLKRLLVLSFGVDWFEFHFARPTASWYSCVINLISGFVLFPTNCMCNMKALTTTKAPPG